jgi:hypothetical protein
MTFGIADYQTPHGGPPFHGWKKGFGFGKTAGAGRSVMDPATPLMLRSTPQGDRGFASNPFWRNKYELGLTASLGIGERPDYARMANKSGSVAPDNYGDVSKHLVNAKRNYTRSGITVRKKFPSVAENCNKWPTGGPGPAKYDISYAPGQSSWTHPCKLTSPSFNSRSIADPELRYSMSQPGPDAYNVRIPAGTNSPIKHGTLYECALKGRTKIVLPGNASPGPAKYILKSQMQGDGLDVRIKNTKVPKTTLPKKQTVHSSSMPTVMMEDIDDSMLSRSTQVPDTSNIEDGLGKTGSSTAGTVRCD